jgi:hypothetical protein
MAAGNALLLVAGLLAGTPPNFSGKWIVDFDRSEVRTADGKTVGMRVLGEAFTAEQTGNALTLVLDSEKGRRWTYRLDGVETTTTAPDHLGRVVPIKYRASWSGPTLTINGQWTVDGKSGRSFLRLTLNPDGSIRAEAGPGEGEDVRMVSVYKRSP